jgi:hypothetical protein
MMLGTRLAGVFTAFVLGVVLGGTAVAAPVTFSGATSNEFDLTGPGQVVWTVKNNVFNCDSGPGFGIFDAEFTPSHNDAFDDGLIVTINGTPFISPDSLDLTGQILTSGPISMSGLDVTVQYAALQDRPTLRTFIGLHNPSGSPITAALNVQTNFGSDASTTQITTGTNGDWFVSADSPTTPGDAVNTTVYGGAQVGDFDFDDWLGLTTNTVYLCSGTEGFGVSNNVTIPPGGSLNFIYLNEMHDTIAAATTAATASFETVPARTTSFFQDLSDDQLIHTGNYSFLGERVLNGGGARWWVYNWAGTDTGDVSGKCEYSPGLAVGDATLDPTGINKDDAFDDGLVFWVDGKNVVAPLTTPAASDDAVTVGPVSMSGLDVSVTYAALQTSPTLRTIATFTNPTGAAIAATIVMNTNDGSDDGTLIQGTSSGDKTVSTADRWIVSSDSDTAPGDPVNTHVVAGPGTLVAPLTALADQGGTQCSDTGKGPMATYNLTVPAGTTRRLLFFNDLSATNAEGLTSAARYDANPATGSTLVTGLDAPTLTEVVNWAFCSTDASLCASGNACLVDACGATGGCDHTKLPRAASFLSVGCRLDDAIGEVGSGVPAGKLQTQLTTLLNAAKADAQAASTQTGKARKKAVAKALRALKKFNRKLKSKAAKKAISASDLAALKSAASDLAADLKTLKTAP